MNLFEPHFPHSQLNGNNDNSTYFTGWMRGLNDW